MTAVEDILPKQRDRNVLLNVLRHDCLSCTLTTKGGTKEVKKGRKSEERKKDGDGRRRRGKETYAGVYGKRGSYPSIQSLSEQQWRLNQPINCNAGVLQHSLTAPTSLTLINKSLILLYSPPFSLILNMALFLRWRVCV